jgi:hypothetical protein
VVTEKDSTSWQSYGRPAPDQDGWVLVERLLQDLAPL